MDWTDILGPLLVSCECLRQLEICYPSLLSDIAGHLWTLCQSERTHASQSYILLFTAVIYNVVNQELKRFGNDNAGCSSSGVAAIDVEGGVSSEEVGGRKSVVKLFEDGLVSVAAYKWLPPSSTETAVAFRTFHKFLIGASSHTDTSPSTIRILMESTIFHTLQGMLMDMMVEFQILVLVIAAFIDRLLVSYFPVLDRIAENDIIPPGGLLELLTKFMAFLVEKHGPDTGLKSWSQGSKVLGNCQTVLMNHRSSRLFIGLSRLLTFTCLYFPDLEIRDHVRIYLRLLICVPGGKLRSILNLGEQLLSIAPSTHSSSFFNVQSPRHYHDIKKSKNISSYIHLERVIPLLIKQSWPLSLSTIGIGSDKSGFLDTINDTRAIVDEREFDGYINDQIMSETESSIIYHMISETEKIDRPLEPLRVMDSKISEILGILRRHFSCIPDFRHMTGLKVRISCNLRFESEPFTRLWGGDSSTSVLDDVDALPAVYATVLKFSSSAPYGSISSGHIPFLLGEPARKGYISGQMPSLDVAIDNGSGEEETFRASVTIELEPREPTPGLVDVFIETNAENGQIIHGQLQNITVGIEDMFLRAIVPPDIPEDVIPGYYSDLFNALWEACGTSSNIGREAFPLKGGKGVTAINGIRSVRLLEVPADSLIRAIERYLAPFVVSVSGEQLINVVKDGGVIRDVSWKDVVSDSFLDLSTSVTDAERGPLHLTYFGNEDERESQVNISKRNMGSFLILIFLPPRFHLLFQMEVCDVSTLVRIRTDHWPCLAYVDDYLESLC
ncbi:hypothetical protein QYF36_023680 [Acer negundo]|nr:hypothetical protein QYF36_023680 [Acer negundo]